MFALNQGEVCTCPSRALIQEIIYDRFMERAIKRVEAIMQGNPLDSGDDDRRAGFVRADGEDPVVLRHRPAGRRGGADRRRAQPCCPATWRAATTSSRRCFKGHNKMRVFQEEIFGPVRFGHHLQGRRRGDGHRQRHALRPGRRRLDPRRRARLPRRPRRSRPAASGPTATTPIRRTRRSAATSSPASGARTTR